MMDAIWPAFYKITVSPLQKEKFPAYNDPKNVSE